MTGRNNSSAGPPPGPPPEQTLDLGPPAGAPPSACGDPPGPPPQPVSPSPAGGVRAGPPAFDPNERRGPPTPHAPPPRPAEESAAPAEGDKIVVSGNKEHAFEAATMHFACFIKLRCLVRGTPAGAVGCPMCDVGLVKFTMAPDGRTAGECSSGGCLKWIDNG